MKIPCEACAYGNLGKPVATSRRDVMVYVIYIDLCIVLSRDAQTISRQPIYVVSQLTFLARLMVYIYCLSLRYAQELLSRFSAHVTPTDSPTSER